MKKLFLTLIVAFVTVCGFAQESIDYNKKLHCHIEGEVKESTFTRILLMIGNGDPRVVPVDTIWVKDGHFSYDLYIDEPEFYQLFACEDYNNGCWMTLDFFAEEGDVYATFYGYAIDDAPRPTLHSETPLNKELLAYNKSIEERFYIPMRQEEEVLEKAGKLLTAEGAALKKLYDECEDRDSLNSLSEKIELLEKENRFYTQEYKVFMEKGEKLRKEMYAYELDYIMNYPGMVGLYLLDQVRYRLYNKDNATKQPYVDVFKRVYDARYPTNNMAIALRNWVSSMDVRVGSRIIDFTLPDLNGAKHTLSKEIEGKIAIVDFWASWCGPCRRTSMSFIPLYNKYKDKGFTVVGVASELESEDMRLAVEKDGYPWLNLLALRGVDNIWERYGIRGAGEVFLVDKDGTILVIGATAEEVEQILKERL
ncbi:MAG: AhpC/TSA family protein [Bacteroidaceae bacterium]|nr:AhpC/TSA family protein [Bacteroidaceae bacterium]